MTAAHYEGDSMSDIGESVVDSVKAFSMYYAQLEFICRDVCTWLQMGLTEAHTYVGTHTLQHVLWQAMMSGNGWC